MKWGGAAATVVLAAIWVSSGWWEAAYGPRNGMRFEIVAYSGLMRIAWTDSRDVPPHFAEGGSFYTGEFRLYWWAWRWYARDSLASITAGRLKGDFLVVFPLWVFPLAMVPPTLLAWRLDARARRSSYSGTCISCRYSRAGLAPATPCPECGTVNPIANM